MRKNICLNLKKNKDVEKKIFQKCEYLQIKCLFL